MQEVSARSLLKSMKNKTMMTPGQMGLAGTIGQAVMESIIWIPELSEFRLSKGVMLQFYLFHDDV